MAHPNFTGGPIRRSIPSETAPVITDGDLVLVESGAIIEYVIAKHGGGHLAVTADSPDYADYLY